MGLTNSPELYAFCTKGVMIYKGSVYRRCWTAHTGVEKSFVGLCELVSYSKTLAFVGKRGIFSLTAGISFRRFRKPAYCTVSLGERWRHPSVEALSTRTPELRALSLAQNGPGEPSMERKKALATFSALKWIGEISRI